MHESPCLLIVGNMIRAPPLAELSHCLRAEHPVDGIGDLLRVAVGFVQFAQLVFPALPLPREDGDVAVAPAIDRLLAVADDKDAFLTIGLHRLVNEIAQSIPLFMARILELVQCPMTDAGVHTVFQREPRIRRQRGNQARHITEGQAATRANLPRILLLERLEKRVETLGCLHLPPEIESPHQPYDPNRHGVTLQNLRDLRDLPFEFANSLDESVRPSLSSKGRKSIGTGANLLDCRRKLLGGLVPDPRRVAPTRAIRMIQIQTMPILDQLGIGLEERARRLAIHGLAKGRGKRAFRVLVAPPEDRKRDACALTTLVEVPQHGDVTRKAQLKRKHLHKAHEETVERADQREVLRIHHLA